MIPFFCTGVGNYLDIYKKRNLISPFSAQVFEITLISAKKNLIVFSAQVLENICYCAHHYNTEKARCANNPDNFEKGVSLSEYFHSKDCPYE